MQRSRPKAQARGFSLRPSAERPVTGRWDRELVQRAIGNVVGYLLDSAPPGEIELGAHRSRGGARAVVRVQGFGIPAADQAELLRGGPDVSTPDRLGLFIARRIIEAQGASAEAAARLHSGQSVALAAIESRFSETGAVNIDQEMAHLVQLQTAYGANARVMSAVREMLDLLMRM